MSTRFMGVPSWIWGCVCLVVAAVWMVVWPSDRAAGAAGVRYIILRWSHALVWILLASAAFIAGFGALGGAGTAKPVALLSLAVYVILMLTLAMSQVRR